jgi:hypothetical protein
MILLISFLLLALPAPERVRQVYLSQLHVREATGRNDGVEVEAYQRATGNKKGDAWCASFVFWCFRQACIKTPGPNAWSPSWFPAARTIYKSGKGQTPRTADVFGIHFSQLGRVGHVGFIDEWDERGGLALTVEGNTSGQGTGLSSREGDGVYRKRRPIRQIYLVSRWT